MKFTNNTGKEVQIRLDDGNNSYIWKVIEPNEEIDSEQIGILEDYCKRLGLTEVTDESNQVKPIENNTIQPANPEEFKMQEPEPEFVEELKKTKGIGKKIIKDILGVFPTKEKLQEAIKSGIELPFNSKIDKILRDRYG